MDSSGHGLVTDWGMSVLLWQDEERRRADREWAEVRQDLENHYQFTIPRIDGKVVLEDRSDPR